MKRLWIAISLLSITALIFAPAAVQAKGDGTGGYQTGFQLYRGSESGFKGWVLEGVQAVNGSALMLYSSGLTSGTDIAGNYNGGNYYNGGAYEYGVATSPELVTGFAFKEAIASWNAVTPAGTWIETWVRARLGTRWTKWYSLGVWASGDEAVSRHSVNLQGDGDGYVAVDTLVLGKTKLPADALQLKVSLMRTAGSVDTPVVNNISLAYSTEAPKSSQTSAGDPANWNTLLDVPECSQMVYPNGGSVWCSPTSTSMVLGSWGIDPGECEPRVLAAVAGVYDWVYDGHGNWPFNTAYAASRLAPSGGRMEGYVARYTGLDKLEPLVKAGVPVVMSIAWGKKDLTNAAVSSSNGHLVVLVGFDASGNPIVNDPAASANEDVQRTFVRGELEKVWLTNSGGTGYVIFPEGRTVPGF